MRARWTIEADVAVVGAGSAGCCAALAAARAGAEVVLVDRLGFPGGTSTGVLDTFYAFFTAGERPRKIVSGLPDEPVAALGRLGKVVERPNSFGSGTGYTYDPETLKLVWADLLRAAGVTTLLHTVVCDAERRDARAPLLTAANRAGLGAIDARVVVDASGDADVVLRCGGRFVEDDEPRQPATVTFRMAPVDLERFRSDGRPRLRELVAAARRDGFDLPGEGGSLHASGAPATVLTAVTRLPAPDYDDPRSAGRLELDGLAQVEEWTRFFKSYMPGFEAAELSAIGAMAGVRETRRIAGEHVLTEDDVLQARRFDDQIALCGAPIEDLAHPTTRWVHVGGSGAYGIPWRALLPRGLSGVVVAGRCLSATHAAHASARSMATCMAMGQAAGTAAALAVAAGTGPHDVEAGRLRDELARAGAQVDG